MKLEIWLPIPGYEDSYEASDFGQIRSVPREQARPNRWCTTTIHFLKGRTLKPHINKKGYSYHQLGAGAKNKKETHYWIAITFLGPKIGLLEVNHKNGIKEDNRIVSIEWVSRAENSQHAFRTGLNHSGPKHGIAKLTEDEVFQIKNILVGKKPWGSPYYKDIATAYGVDRKTIESIAKNKTWRQV